MGFLLLGLLCIYGIFLWATRCNYLVSIICTLLINTSGNLNYYGVATLSDIHALGLSCAGIFLFTKWIEKKQHKYLIWCAALYTLAVLLKASSAFSYIICVAAFFFIQVSSIRNEKKSIKGLLIGLFIFVIPFTFWYAWYSHADAYNSQHPNSFFLIGILPIWGCDTNAERVDILRSLISDKIHEMYHPFILIGLLFLVITFTISFIKKHPLLIAVMWLSLLSFVSFILLFYAVFSEHDYYLINMTSLVVIIITVLLRIISNNYPTHTTPYPVKIFMFTALSLFTFVASVKIWARISYKSETVNSALVFDVEKNRYYGWNEWFDKTRFKIIEDKQFKLEKFGIMPYDTILCLGDMSINRSLYLLQRVGYTSYNTSIDDAPAFIKQHNLKWLIVIEPDWKYKDFMKPFYQDKLFDNESTSIYKLR